MDFATQYTGATVIPDVIAPEVSQLPVQPGSGLRRRPEVPWCEREPLEAHGHELPRPDLEVAADVPTARDWRHRQTPTVSG